MAEGIYGDKTIDEWISEEEQLKWEWTDSDNSGGISEKDLVTYGEIEYLVFSQTENTVELISANALGILTLGGSTWEEGLAAYQNAVETIVTKCKEVTGLEVDGQNVISIRSVGNENVKYTKNGIVGEDTATYFNSQYMISNVEGYVNDGSGGWFADYDASNIKQTDENYLNDYNKMEELEILTPPLPENCHGYWLASRYVAAYPTVVQPSVRHVYYTSSSIASMTCEVYEDLGAWGDTGKNAVRPVVTLSMGVLAP